MGKFLTFLFLIIFFQSEVKADDIRELEIEGISIDNNALNFYQKKILDENKRYYPNSKKIWRTYIKLKDNKFELIQLHLDNNYKVVAVAGIIYFKDRANGKKNCINKRNEIVEDLSSVLKNTIKSSEEKNIHDGDITGKSYELAVFFDFKDDYSEYVKVGCLISSNEYYNSKKQDHHLRLSLTSSKYHFWLKDEAY
mgnify:CR=1 FL=1